MEATSNSGRAGAVWASRMAEAENPRIYSVNTSHTVTYECTGKNDPSIVRAFCRPPRALFGADGTDDEVARVPLDRCPLPRGSRRLPSAPGRRAGQDPGRFEHDVADDFAAAFEESLRVGESGALQEEEGDPAGIEGDGEGRLGGTLGGAETDDQGIVVVVDQLYRRRAASSLMRARWRVP